MNMDSRDSAGESRYPNKADGASAKAGSLRIGGVVYLNARPLLWSLRELLQDAQVFYDVPSRLAIRLAAGQLDIAIVPVIEAFRHPEYVVVSDACIAAAGAARSVMIYSSVPLDRVRTVALDAGSRTSAAVTRILLAEKYGVHPEFREFPLTQGIDEITSDAVLVIGDRAMTLGNPPLPLTYDLGLEWRSWTGLPLVFAVWVGQPAGRDWTAEARIFAEARDRGLAALDRIAKEAAIDLGLPYQECYDYLAKNLHFKLGQQEYESLALFGRLAAKYGFVAPESALRFHH